ncbi:MAG TPA: T9SS type A sorting domain-containing protein [bacterium]|nr:T9SS type A sorting domain-containing protein [bacterium]
MEYAATFSKWDIVGFTVDVQDYLPQLITTIRSLNPEVKTIAYFPSAYIWDVYDHNSPTVVGFANKLAQEDWWLYDNHGERIGQAGNLWYLNLTTKCHPDGSGQILAEWLGHYIASQVMARGYWNGTILDGVDEDIRWLNSCPTFFSHPPAAVDCNRDGIADNIDSLYVWWRRGAELFLTTLRHDAGASCIILPNGNNTFFQLANGGIRENFPHMHGGWQENMFASYGYINCCKDFLHNPINASMMTCYWPAGDNDRLAPPRTQAFEQFMRFTLTSALLGDGYYYLDCGSGGALWWMDYYDLDVGVPTGEAFLDTIVNYLDNSTCTIWRRQFTNADVWCNPSSKWILFADGTYLWPQDGAIKVKSLPGPVDCTIRRETLDREFSQRQRGVGLQVVVSNPNPKAAMAYIWVDLLSRDGTLLIAGPTQEHVIGIGRTDTLYAGLSARSTLDLATYRLRVRVGGPGKTATDEDTVYVRKIVDFSKDGRRLDDANKHASNTPTTGEDSLVVYPQPMLLSDAGTLMLEVNELTSVAEGAPCSVKLYDATGRLVNTVYEGKLEKGQTLVIGEVGKGGVPKVPGVYFLHVETGAKAITKKIVLLR